MNEDIMTERRPAEVFPPGVYLQEEIEARGWIQSEFAEIIGKPPALVNEIIKAKRAITPDTAQAIAAALGTSAELWLNLEAAHQLYNKTAPAPPRIRIEAKLRERFPVREMINRGWIDRSDNADVLTRRVLDFYEIGDLDEQPRLATAAKKAAHKAADPEALANLTPLQTAWVFRVRQIARTMVVPKYSESVLRDALVELKALLVAPEEIRHVAPLLEKCGVRFVIVEPFSGSGIDGVCFWLDDNPWQPVIGMSLRFDRIDNFWFVLRHEIEHVLRRHAMVVDIDLEKAGPDVSEQELQATSAALEFPMPTEELDDFIARKRPIFSEKQVIGFANRFGVHPGIVVGQLQYRTQRFNLLRTHLTKIRDVVTASAVTDGYGRTFQVN
jgi:HTH-type transcriptional regulator/antitoxin HigA